MQTLLYVSRMTTGDEVAVRKAHESFPVEVLAGGLGIERFVAFIGSGFYAMEITVGDGNVQENLHRFLAAPEVQALFGALRPHVDNLPRPDEQTAEMPLATAMLVWQSDPEKNLTAV